MYACTMDCGDRRHELSSQMGVSREYVGAILNGKREPAEAEHRIREAVDDLIAQKSSTK